MAVRRLTASLMTVAALMAMARSVEAQDARNVGLVVGYPGAVGVVWQITDRIAVRPDFSIVKSTTESTSSPVLPPGIPPGFSISPSKSTSDGWGSTWWACDRPSA